MTHYHYDPESLVFLVEADAPAPGLPFSLQAPPATAEHQAARALPHESGDPGLCAWEVLEDWRGVTVHDAATGAPRVIDELGPLPEGVRLEPPPPARVTMRQARLALLQSGLLPSADAALAAMPGEAGAAARIEWEYATTVERASPLVAGMAAALGLTEQQLDALFAAAAAL